MKKKLSIRILLIVTALVMIGCAYENEGGMFDPGFADNGFPRLVVSGKVTNASDEPLEGIYVAIFGVREPDEDDIFSYNYTLTDALGQYTVIRYRGRQLPTEVTVVATDSAGIYQEQIRFASVTYDTIVTPSGKQPCNAFVTADFVLSLQE